MKFPASGLDNRWFYSSAPWRTAIPRGIRPRKNGGQYRNVISEFAAKLNSLGDLSKSFQKRQESCSPVERYVTLSIPARFDSPSRAVWPRKFRLAWPRVGKQINQRLSGYIVARWFRSFLRSPVIPVFARNETTEDASVVVDLLIWFIISDLEFREEDKRCLGKRTSHSMLL